MSRPSSRNKTRGKKGCRNTRIGPITTSPQTKIGHSPPQNIFHQIKVQTERKPRRIKKDTVQLKNKAEEQLITHRQKKFQKSRSK